MSTITELTIFKKCIDQPIFAMLESLNMQNIKFDNEEDLSPNLILKKKGIRLYQMFWSGLTKYMRQVINIQSKAIELPNFAIITPGEHTN